MRTLAAYSPPRSTASMVCELVVVLIISFLLPPMFRRFPFPFITGQCGFHSKTGNLSIFPSFNNILLIASDVQHDRCWNGFSSSWLWNTCGSFWRNCCDTVRYQVGLVLNCRRSSVKTVQTHAQTEPIISSSFVRRQELVEIKTRYLEAAPKFYANRFHRILSINCPGVAIWTLLRIHLQPALWITH